MAITATDVSVAANGDIRWTGGATTYTVLELHRFLQDLADQAAASGNDLVDITSSTPSERSTDNIITLLGSYNIDDTMAQHLYDGSISQASGAEMYSGLVVVGAVAGATTLQIVQDNLLYDGDTPFWGTGLNANATQNILMRCLVKTRTAGVDIDGKKVRVFAREWGHTFAEFEVTMGLGNSVAAIFTNMDLNNQTASGTVATWTTIVNVEGYQTIDLGNGNGARPYYSQWDRAAYSINQLYERAKYITRRGTSETIHGMDGELFRGITHEWAFDTEGGTGTQFTEDEILTWGTGATAGSAVLLALNDTGSSGTVWVQLTKGVPPTDNMVVTGSTSNHTAQVQGSVTTRSLSPVFIGSSTGSAIIGAFGVGVQSADLTVNDKLTDLLNVLQQPPNNVSFTVSGLISGEDRVLVAPASGGLIDYDQMTLNGALSGGEATIVVQTSSVPLDTPNSGTIRVLGTDGVYHRVTYTGRTVSSFTGCSGTPAASNGANVFISYIDVLADDTSESVTVVYNSDRDLFIRVRDGGGTPIKTFEVVAQIKSTNQSVSAIRTSDL